MGEFIEKVAREVQRYSSFTRKKKAKNRSEQHKEERARRSIQRKTMPKKKRGKEGRS